jgi:MSHA pilin protein MshA
MKVKANQQGFTLIELVVVIVILGILAVTAAPKFIDLTGDAKKSVVQAVKASLSSARDLAHAKVIVNGNLNANAISIAGKNITLSGSYPAATSIADLIDLEVSNSSSEAVFELDDTTSAGIATFSYIGVSDCQAVYTQTSNKDIPPEITVTTTGC